MSLSDCPDCWDTPCTCSKGFLGSKVHAFKELQEQLSKEQSRTLRLAGEVQSLQTQLQSLREHLKELNDSASERILKDLSMKKDVLNLIETYLQAGPMDLKDFKELTKDRV